MGKLGRTCIMIIEVDKLLLPHQIRHFWLFRLHYLVADVPMSSPSRAYLWSIRVYDKYDSMPSAQHAAFGTGVDFGVHFAQAQLIVFSTVESLARPQFYTWDSKRFRTRHFKAYLMAALTRHKPYTAVPQKSWCGFYLAWLTTITLYSSSQNSLFDAAVFDGVWLSATLDSSCRPVFNAPQIFCRWSIPLCLRIPHMLLALTDSSYERARLL